MKASEIDVKKYGGMYVATESFTTNVVVAFGKNPSKVMKEAIELGIKEPVVNYIHKEGVICIY